MTQFRTPTHGGRNAPSDSMRRPFASESTRYLSSLGFTLLELLVVMSLMSLLVLAMASALRTTSQTGERVDRVLVRVEDQRITTEFLQSILGRISLQKRLPPYQEGASTFFFEGTSARLTWLGVMPAGYATGGQTLMRLSQRMSPIGRGELVLEYLPWLGPVGDPDWSQAKSEVLLRGALQVNFSYEDARPEPPQWTPNWTLVDQMPQRVAVSLQTEQGLWPTQIISMRPMPAGDPRARGPIFGGSVR